MVTYEFLVKVELNDSFEIQGQSRLGCIGIGTCIVIEGNSQKAYYN